MKSPWRDIVRRRYSQQLVMAVAIPLFQQMTGINVIMFYAPVLFNTLGFGLRRQRVADFGGDHRRREHGRDVGVSVHGGQGGGGAQMLVSQVTVGAIPARYAKAVVVVICAYVAAFAWSWRPLAWLVPSEVMSLEVRPAGQSITVAVNMLMTFTVAQAFLPMLCRLKILLFFAAWVTVMALFVALFVPETKGVSIEDMSSLWSSHWYWRRFVDGDDHASHLRDIEMGTK
ncbi:hypothetical protein GUJ93_ZPchr0009g2245 [Zizania palustris]|uniref:Major facilitator superfamily (MFS) profile domain-containing protein n=1 Tax=Zizania palustris TaxID=103762 RepID=A0A8J5V308_ZIZPA|nr:hypothetical protein GUJ93_ZPchr0009g2245 [Zizania palustris]